MKMLSFFRDSKKVSRLCTLIIFLALIRTISEPFRLQYYSATELTYHTMQPFLLGALIAAAGLLAMTILSYYRKYRIITGTCILVIVLLLIVKMWYLVP